MRKRPVDENKLKQYSIEQIDIADIVNVDDAVARVYFADEAERYDAIYLKSILVDKGRGKQYGIYVYPTAEGRYRLLYGQKRLYAALQNGLSQVKANLISPRTDLDFETIQTLYELDFESHSSYDKGRIISELASESGKKIESLAQQVGLSYHTLRSLESAYKTAMKYPSLGKAYQEQQINQLIVNSSASWYACLSADDQQTLTDYLVLKTEDGFTRLKKAVKSNTNKPLRNRIIDYIAVDTQALRSGGDRPVPDVYIPPDQALTPLLPGDKEGSGSFTQMYGLTYEGIEFFQQIDKELQTRKRIGQCEPGKVSKTVYKSFYLLCGDGLIIPNVENLAHLDQLWKTDSFPESMGSYLLNFESCYNCHTFLSNCGKVVYNLRFADVLMIPDTTTRSVQYYRKKHPAIDIPEMRSARPFYFRMIDMVERFGDVDDELMSSIIALYYADSEVLKTTRKMFDSSIRYRKAKERVRLEIAEIAYRRLFLK